MINFGWGGMAFRYQPPSSSSLGSILYALEVPSKGGDTLFANQYVAYETLNKDIKEKINSLNAIHANGRIHNTLKNNRIPERGEEVDSAGYSDAWSTSIVRTHLQTKEGSLCEFNAYWIY